MVFLFPLSYDRFMCSCYGRRHGRSVEAGSVQIRGAGILLLYVWLIC